MYYVSVSVEHRKGWKDEKASNIHDISNNQRHMLHSYSLDWIRLPAGDIQLGPTCFMPKKCKHSSQLLIKRQATEKAGRTCPCVWPIILCVNRRQLCLVQNAFSNLTSGSILYHQHRKRLWQRLDAEIPHSPRYRWGRPSSCPYHSLSLAASPFLSLASCSAF